MVIRKKYCPLLITIFLVALLYVLSKNIPEENFRSIITNAGIWGPLTFTFLMLATHIFAPLSGTPLVFAGFYAFGEDVVFLTTLVAFVSSFTNFWIARIWGRSLVIKFVGRENTGKIDRLTQDYGLWTLFFLRVFMGGSTDFISYAAGLTSLQFLPYFIISVLVAIPGTILWYLIALQINDPLIFTALTLLLISTLSLIFVLATLAFKGRRR